MTKIGFAGVTFAVAAITIVGTTAAIAGGIRYNANPKMRGAMNSDTTGQCSTSFVRMCDGCKINVTMRVSAGATCHLSLRSPRPLLSHEVIERPMHGRYGSAGVSDAAYIAPDGYTGPDAFVLSIYRVAADNQKARETRMNVRVDVVP